MPRVRDGRLEEGPLAALQLVPQLLQVAAVLCGAAAGAGGAAEGPHFRHRRHRPPLLVLGVGRLVHRYEAARWDLAARVHTHRARVSSGHTLCHRFCIWNCINLRSRVVSLQTAQTWAN